MRRKDREITGKDEIESIILQCKTCHVAMVDHGLPYVVPLSFGYQFVNSDTVETVCTVEPRHIMTPVHTVTLMHTLELYFHSAWEGKKLDIFRRNNKVCFEMACEGESVHPENPCSSGYYFASVIGDGKVVFIQDNGEKCGALSLMAKHQLGKDVVFSADQAETVCVYKIISTSFTGKRKPKPKLEHDWMIKNERLSRHDNHYF